MLANPAITVVYYLFTLFGIFTGLAFAWWHWQSTESFRARRLMIVFGGLAVLRLMFLALGLVGTSATDIGAWVPAFERTMQVASLGFLLWGFTPLLRNRSFAGLVLLANNTAFAFVFYGLAVAFWTGTNFNLSGWDIFFVVWQLGLVSFGIVNCISKIDNERIYALLSFVVLAIGCLLHLILGSLYVLPNAPIWIRLAELIAYPLLAVAVGQNAFLSLTARSREFQTLSQVSIGQIKELINLFEATRQITASLDLANVLDSAAKSVAEAIVADQCALALPEQASDMSHLRLVAIYNPSRQGRGESVSFPLNDQQAIKHALKRKYQVRIDEFKDNSQIAFLFTLMGASDVGPLLIQPLLQDEEPIGVLILGNAQSQRVFSDSEAQLCKSLGDQVTVSIQHAKEYSTVLAKAQQLSWTLRNQELEAGKRRAAMETELKKSREEVNLFAQRLSSYEATERQLSEQLTEANERTARAEKMIDRAKVEIEKLNTRIKHLNTVAQDNEANKHKLASLTSERAALTARLDQLEQDAAEARQLSEALEAANDRARKLARVLKRTRDRAQKAAVNPNGETIAALEGLSYGVIVGDANYRINRANAAAAAMLSQPALVGRDLAAITDDERWHTALTAVQSKNEPLVTTTLNVGDSVLRATISLMPTTDGNGQSGTVTILFDVTSEAEGQRARDEFVASLSQELRTPMTSITGYTDLLIGESVGDVGEMQRKFLQRIKANIERMGSMLSDLIGVTAIDAGQLEIRPTIVNVAEIIEDTIIGARAQLEENELFLDINLPEEVPPVEADPDSVRQILTNLLSNAIKVTPQGSAIAIAAARYNNDDSESDPDAPEQRAFLQISVADSGGGIPAKDIGRVFDRFYVAEHPLIEGLGETGVGLALVKSMVEAHQGRVWVETEIGEGSTFHFLLPISDKFDDPWLEVDIPPLDLNSDPLDDIL